MLDLTLVDLSVPLRLDLQPRTASGCASVTPVIGTLQMEVDAYAWLLAFQWKRRMITLRGSLMALPIYCQCSHPPEEEATSKEPAQEAKDTAEVAAPAEAIATIDEKKPAEASSAGGLSAMTIAKVQEAAAELREQDALGMKTLELAELQVEAAPEAQKDALCKLWPVC